MMGAMVFNSAGGEKRQKGEDRIVLKVIINPVDLPFSIQTIIAQSFCWSSLGVRGSLQSLTNENEADSDDVRQQVASERFVILAVTFAKEADERVEFVLTQTLPEKKERQDK